MNRNKKPRKQRFRWNTTDEDVAIMQNYRNELINYYIYGSKDITYYKRSIRMAEIMQEINAVETWIDNAIKDNLHNANFFNF